MQVKHTLLLVIFILCGNYAGNPSGSIPTENPLPEHKVSLLFVGDIMGHGPQIESAFNALTGQYSFDTVFYYIKSILSEPDFTIANFEVTLAGKPYTGYPQFSSPDALAFACKNAGMDVLVTANNHCCDRGLLGLTRTIQVLDSLQIPHTGTFESQEAKDTSNLIILEKNTIRIGLLNYTYGTNGIPIPEPAVVNVIDKETMKTDIDSALNKQLDKLIVFLHFGNEYELSPNSHQTTLVSELFEAGVDVVIGSHPHVIQKMMFLPGNDSIKDHFAAYSLGNFVSNQRKLNTDGGVMPFLVFKKSNGITTIDQSRFVLSWVYKKVSKSGNTEYFVLPAADYEKNPDFFEFPEDHEKMKLYIRNSRDLLNSQNLNVSEYIR